MILFFDTSALVKFFHNEDGTEAVTDLLNSQENKIWISELVKLEFISALHRRFRNKEIDETIKTLDIIPQHPYISSAFELII